MLLDKIKHPGWSDQEGVCVCVCVCVDRKSNWHAPIWYTKQSECKQKPECENRKNEMC